MKENTVTTTHVIHPLWNINTKFQPNKSWITQYKGMNTKALAFPKIALKIDAKEWLESIFLEQENPLSTSLIAGLLSLNYFPFEFFMSFKPKDNSKKLSIPYLIKTKGLHDTGIAVCALSLQQLLNPLLKNDLSVTSSDVMSGVVAGILATIITHPLCALKKSPTLGFTQIAKQLSITSMLKGMSVRGSLIILSMTLINSINRELDMESGLSIELSINKKKR